MTVHEEHAHAHGVRSEEDTISTPRIIAVGIASLVIFIVSGGLVSIFYEARMTAARLPPIPAEIGRSKIGMVEQQIYDLANRGARDREVRLERLGGYGWVDRGAGIVHIPIEQAMGLVEKGVRARGGTGQQQRDGGGQP